MTFDYNVESPGLVIIIILFCSSLFLPILVTSTFWNFLGPEMEIEQPSWNDTLSMTRPLSFIQFIGYWSLFVSFASLLTTLVKIGLVNFGSLAGLSIGLGLLIGIRVRLKVKK